MNKRQIINQTVWDTADMILRKITNRANYGMYILPFVTLRRLECVLEDNMWAHDPEAPSLKEAINASVEGVDLDEDMRDMLIFNRFGISYNSSSALNLKEIAESNRASVLDGMFEYLDSFNRPVREIWDKFEFKRSLKNLEESNRLWQMIDHFSNLNLHPDYMSNSDMGDLFENLMYRSFTSSAADSGEFYTPRDAVDLMADIVFASDDTGLEGNRPARSVYDPTAGTGGMLLRAKSYLENINPNADVTLFGQESSPQSWAIGAADLLIQGASTGFNIRLGDTLERDLHEGSQFDYVMANPPYGTDWRDVQDSVEAEAQEPGSRFSPGLPPTNDGQLLFFEHIISKMRDAGENGTGGRAAVVSNASPLFNGNAGTGSDRIRKWMLESGYVDAVIALPAFMFYNTSIPTYVWIFDKNQTPERKGKVQVIDATSLSTEMARPLGSKKQEFTPEQRKFIRDLYFDFENNEYSQIVDALDLGHYEVPTWIPYRVRLEITDDTVSRALDHPEAVDAHEPIIRGLAGLDYAQAYKALTDGCKKYNANNGFKAKDAGHLKMSKKLRDHILDAISVEDENAPVARDAKGEPIRHPDNKILEVFSYINDPDEYIQHSILDDDPDTVVLRDKLSSGFEISFKKVMAGAHKKPTADEIVQKMKSEMNELKALMDTVSSS